MSRPRRPIRVLVVEDSATARQLLVELLRGDGAFEVVGEADSGIAAVEAAARLRPDLITMDVHLPGLDGLAATRQIMREAPTPIVIVSSTISPSDVKAALTATQAGALMVVPKPTHPGDPDFPRQRAEFLTMARGMAEVRVVRRWGGVHAGAPRPPRRFPASATPQLVAIGTSTGGPAALLRILSDLPSHFPLPIVVVQHMAHGFMDGLTGWLGANSGRRVEIATAGLQLSPGVTYIAPDDHHLGVTTSGRAVLNRGPAINGFRPSVDHLFEQCALTYGPSLLAVILTGMGQDGLAGLRVVKQRGGRVIAQDEASSVVFGMARGAVLEGLADEVLPLDDIGRRIGAVTAEEEAAS